MADPSSVQRVHRFANWCAAGAARSRASKMAAFAPPSLRPSLPPGEALCGGRAAPELVSSGKADALAARHSAKERLKL
jgi:hypothetical protein